MGDRRDAAELEAGEARDRARLRCAGLAAAALAGVLGTVGLGASIAGLDALQRPFPGAPPMAGQTGLILALVAIAQLAGLSGSRGLRRLGVAAGATGLVLALVALARSAASLTPLPRGTLTIVGTGRPLEQPSAHAALALTFVAIAVLLAGRRGRIRSALVVSGASGAAAVVALAAVGFAGQVGGRVGLSAWIAMAPQTALAVALLVSSTFAARPWAAPGLWFASRGSAELAARQAQRYALPAPLAAAALAHLGVRWRWWDDSLAVSITTLAALVTAQVLIARMVRTVRAHDADRRRLERERRAAEEVLRLSFENAPIGKALVSPTGTFLRVNRALAEMTGYAPDELLGRSFQDITDADDLEADLDLLEGMLAGERHRYEIEKRYVRADGRRIWILLSASLVRDEDGAPRYVIAQMQDITERKQAERELRHLSDHDGLTGLANRRRLEAELGRRLADHQRHRRDFSVVLLDLDRFKEVNDGLGHAAGDRVLRAVADTLRERLRATDLVARLGGDEFACLLAESAGQEARDVAAELLARIRDVRVVHGDVVLRVGASAGVADTTELAHPTAEALLVAADAAMYAVKRRGRGAAADPASEPTALVARSAPVAARGRTLRRD
ncbi:diguanylate cyclase [Patulibacter brassicae]|uniref:Diguanylate cyclase n=1 Tax=Patulibacter brassicae TaxID=1705717 RepID=A0ABU4VJL6_9ACTN|nr:diguanylate cyclase [Patulibacter brassicae]MDX8152022.1 diguanylate cyclase [Patulibacter brassicae]